MKVRLKFTKTGPIRFVGHLDLMRTFQKIFRQSSIPIAYSEGFNPHQIFSIAAPLSVGVTGEGEYLDMKLTQKCTPEDLIAQINLSCPRGLSIIEAVELDEKETSAMASVAAAKYIITQNKQIIKQEIIDALSQKENLIITKKTKKGKIKEMDIKPGIINAAVLDGKIVLTLSTGSVFNVKPDAVLRLLVEEAGQDYNPFDFSIHREDLYWGEYNLISLSKPELTPF